MAAQAASTWYSSDAELPPYGLMDLYPRRGVSKGITYRHYTGTPSVHFGSALLGCFI